MILEESDHMAVVSVHAFLQVRYQPNIYFLYFTFLIFSLAWNSLNFEFFLNNFNNMIFFLSNYVSFHYEFFYHLFSPKVILLFVLFLLFLITLFLSMIFDFSFFVLYDILQNLYFYASESNEEFRKHMLVETLLIPRLVLPYLDRYVTLTVSLLFFSLLLHRNFSCLWPYHISGFFNI